MASGDAFAESDLGPDDAGYGGVTDPDPLCESSAEQGTDHPCTGEVSADWFPPADEVPGEPGTGEHGEPSGEPVPTADDPTVVDPTVVDPTVVEPAGVDPTWVDPTWVDPTAVDPATAGPAAVDPTWVDPTVVAPAVPDVPVPAGEPVAPAGGGGATLPPGAEVVATDASGAPTHVVLDQVVAPPTTMVTMGGNDAAYAPGTPDTGHVVSTTPIPGSTTVETFGGQTRVPDPSFDYPAPGSAAARGVPQPYGVVPASNYQQAPMTELITGAQTVLDSSGMPTGDYITQGGKVVHDLGEAIDHNEAINRGEAEPL